MIHSKFAEHLEEDIAINSTVTFDLPVEISTKPHVFVKVWFKNSNANATPSAGTITSISLSPLGRTDQYEAMAGSATVAATAAIPTFNAAGNFAKCQVITDSLASVDEVVVKVTANEG